MMYDRVAIAAALTCLTGCSAIAPLSGYSFDLADSGQHPDDAGQPRDGGGPDAGSGDAGRHVIDAGHDSGPLDAGLDSSVRDAAPELDAGPDTDLTIACSMPGSISGAGETIQVAYEIGNLATVSGAAGFHIAVQMAHGDPGTFESVADTPYAAVLMPGSTDSGDISFVAPAWIRPGENPLRCVVDSANDVAETDETNNTADMSLVATALPDLTIPYANFTLVPCGTFTVTFDVQNTGVVVASGPFNWNISGGDGSAGGTLASGTISGLDAGATQRITTDATDPSGALYGAGSVSIRVDPTAGGMDRVSESDEGNNLSSRSVTWCGG